MEAAVERMRRLGLGNGKGGSGPCGVGDVTGGEERAGEQGGDEGEREEREEGKGRGDGTAGGRARPTGRPGRAAMEEACHVQTRCK